MFEQGFTEFLIYFVIANVNCNHTKIATTTKIKIVVCIFNLSTSV